jgi:hypothetical protein
LGLLFDASLAFDGPFFQGALVYFNEVQYTDAHFDEVRSSRGSCRAGLSIQQLLGHRLFY